MSGLLKAVQVGDSVLINKLVNVDMVHPDAELDSEGNTPLLIAVSQGFEKIVGKCLII